MGSKGWDRGASFDEIPAAGASLKQQSIRVGKRIAI
jgi:hypothetical protein